MMRTALDIFKVLGRGYGKCAAPGGRQAGSSSCTGSVLASYR